MKKIHFKVISATSHDNDFRATELNEHSLSTKGWISDRNGKYPQEIILELEQLSRIQKIQILSHHCFIASKIDFFVGASHSQFVLPHSNVQYKNIGYVEMSDNEKNDYQSRELKSVNLDAVGSLLKLIIHKNHVNRLNSHSQVGIIAINVLGIEPTEEETRRLQQDNNVARRNPNDERYPKSYNRISSTDDVAFDIYQDPEVANIVQQLEERKQSCIQEEDFDEAKKAKTAISKINELGFSLAKCETDKRKAAESEEFDLAATKKTQADEIRAKIYEILRENNLLDLIKSPLPPLNLSDANSPRRADSSYNMHPDSPKSKGNSPSPRNDPRFRLSPSRARSSGFEDDVDPMSDLDDEQEDQIRKSREQLFVLMREAFGSPLARALQSRKYDERLKALKNVHQEMQQMEPPSDRAIPMLNACSALIKVTMQDVPNMFRAGLDLLKFILTEFISRQNH